MKHRLKAHIDKLIATAVILFIGMAAVISYGIKAKAAAEEKAGGRIDKATEAILEKSGLPVVYINTAEDGKVISSKNYTTVDFKLENPNNATNSNEGGGYPAEQLYDGTAYLKVRGNSTSGLSKKPYKVKLASKTDLLGMGGSKHWVLLANAIDMTGIRNRLLQELAMDLGLDGMKSEPVSLVLNGKYMGVYDLCEQVRIGRSRVDIYDWSELAEDVADAVVRGYIDCGWLRESDYEVKYDSLKEQLERDYFWAVDGTHRIVPEYLGDDPVNLADYYDFSDVPKATGGALIEMDFYAGAGANLRTAYKLPLYISSPDSHESNFDELKNYMADYVQSMEYALHSTDFVFRNSDSHFKNDKEGYYDMRGGRRTGTKYKGTTYSSDRFDGLHYTDFLDMDSVVNNFLICEVADNWDSMKNSFFMYKDIDSKLVFGPVWDFDWAWGNSMYGIDTAGNRNGNFAYAKMWQTTNEWFANEQYYQTQQFNRLLIRDPYFVAKVYERYNEVRDEHIGTLLERFDNEIQRLENALDANYKRWRGTDSSGGLAGNSFLVQRNYTRSFIEQRLEWLDEQFTDLDTLMGSLSGYIQSDAIRVTSVLGADEICGGSGYGNSEPGADEAASTNILSSPADKISATSSDTSGSVVICAETDDSRAEKLSFQVNGKNFYTAEITDGQAEIEIPYEAFSKEQGRISVVQIRAVNKDGEYIKNLNGSENGVYTNAESCYVAFAKNPDEVSRKKSAGRTTDSAEPGDSEGTDAKSGNENQKLLWYAVGALAFIGATTGFVMFRKRKMK